MIIKKEAIESFLRAPRDDYRSWKDLPDEALENERYLLPVKPPIWKKLLRHQKICFLLGVKLGRFAFHLKVGMGKTLAAIALIKYFKKQGEMKCTLVLVPNLSNKVEWADEIEKHSPSTPYVILEGSSKTKWRLLDENPDALVFVETYAGLSRLVGELVPVRGRNGKARNKLQPSPELVAKLASKFDGLILDESTFVSSKMALPYRICRQLQKKARFVFTLSGTPFGRDPQLLWSQFHLLDNGESLGPTLSLYRAAFFNATENGWGGFEYKFKPNMAMALNRCMAHRSISMGPNEGDLPSVVRITKEVRLAKDASSYYANARNLLYEAGDDPHKVREAFVRMRQISSGFLGYRDDVSKGQVFFSPNAKLELLSDLLQKLEGGVDKAIVFHEFIPSGTLICEELAKLKITYARIDGRTKDPEKELHAFKNDPRVTVLVLNHAAGGYGLNLQVANYIYFWESPVSVIMRQQAEARMIRPFSSHGRVFLYDLVAKDTVDKVILAWHREGGDLLKAVVEGKVKL